MSFTFDKLAFPSPQMYVSKDALHHFSVHFGAKKQSQKCLKRGIFHILHFGLQANERAKPPIATLLKNTMIVALLVNIHT